MNQRLALAVFLALTSGAFAQSINVDFDGVDLGPNAAGPSASFGGSIGQPGVWNLARVQNFAVAPISLVGLGGVPTGAVLTVTNPQGGYIDLWSNQNESPDYRNLWNDWLEVQGGGQIRYQISGLAPGYYALTNYVNAVDVGFPLCTVSVVASPDGVQATFPTTTHHVWIVSGSVIDVTLAANPNWAACNGFQLTQLQYLVSSYCAGNPTACPCANMGTPGHGCANSFTGGAHLVALGDPSVGADTLVLDATGVSNAFATFFQGTTTVNGGIGQVLGDGLLCASGSLVRLGTNLADQGHVTYPAGSDLPVSVRGAITASSNAYYQLLYRDSPAYCTAATFNTTNGVRVLWAP